VSGNALATPGGLFLDDADMRPEQPRCILIWDDATGEVAEGLRDLLPRPSSRLAVLGGVATAPLSMRSFGRVVTRGQSTGPVGRVVQFVADDTDRAEDIAQDQSALDALRGLAEYMYDDWDLEGARAITKEVIEIAGAVLGNMPAGAASPDVAPARDGTVCMEWFTSAGSLWVDVGSDRTACVLKKIAGEREEKRFRVDGRDFTSYLRSALEGLYPPRKLGGVSADFVAA